MQGTCIGFGWHTCLYMCEYSSENSSLLRGHRSPLLPLDWPYLPAIVLSSTSTRRVNAEEVNACRCMLRWVSSVEVEGGESSGPGLLDALPRALRFARLSSLFLFGSLSYEYEYEYEYILHLLCKLFFSLLVRLFIHCTCLTISD